MLVFFEGIVMCFILLMYCVVGIRNGAIGLVCLYEKDVQERVVELGLVTKEQIKKQFLVSSILGIVLYSNKVKSANVKSVLHDYAKKHILVGFIAKYYVA